MNVIAWLLVGYMHWGSGGAAIPACAPFADKASCDTVAATLLRIAPAGKAECVQVTIKLPS